MVVDDGAEAESTAPARRHVQDVDPGVALRSTSCAFGSGREYTDKIDWALQFRNPKNICSNQCSGSMTFWCGSGSANPDPAIFVIDLQDAHK